MQTALRSEARLASLYIHVPFCAHKCEYCAFYSQVPRGDLMDRYVGALCRELELLGFPGIPDTVFFGGGTPSLLTVAHWERILAAFDRLGLAGASEWTVECNPATVSPEKARLLRDCGVNRISMGVQSMDEGLLERLGRIHSREMVYRSYEVLRSAGFDNVNLDAMFAIPGQTLEIWDRTLDELLALKPEHLSCYEVIYEEDTPLFDQLQAGEFEVDEALACAMYDRLLERAVGAGLQQYEIANFARIADGLGAGVPGRACRHNVNYWRGGDCYAAGPSATGYTGGLRTRNVSNTERYCVVLEQGERPVEWAERLGPEERAGEAAAFGLRMTGGWDFGEFRRRTGFDLRAGWESELRELEERGYGERDAHGFRLTRQGLRFADGAGALFLRPREAISRPG